MKNNLIGLMTERNINAINGIFGILKSENGFVPLSPTDPINRLAQIIKECQFEIIITENQNISKIYQLKDYLNKLKCLIVLDHLENIEEWRSKFSSISLFDHQDIEKYLPISDRPSKLSEESENIVYTVYTSGTTGKPKGIEITHTNLIPLFYWQLDNFNLGEGIKCLQTLPLNFDFGIQEVFTTLCFGGTLYFTEIDNILNPEMYVNFLNEHKINMVYTTPSFFKEIVEHNKVINNLEVLLLGGEKLSRELMSYAFELLPDACKVFNGYGPTEASINCLMFNVSEEYLSRNEGIQSVPIGTPTGNSQIFVLDEDLKPVPTLVPGEIYISGPGVAKGYFKNKDLTQEKFINNPFETGYETMYKTGDLAHYLPDGNIEFLGRVDNQVKVKGYRIELGEIENILNQYPYINNSVVLVNEQQEIVAFVKLEKPSLVIEQQKFYLYINAKLPRYMVPTKFYKINNLPKTNNGKLDTGYLFNIKESLFATVDNTKHPSFSGIEYQIASIWRDVIGIKEHIGLYDNFFDLGGHSLLLAKVQKNIENKFGVFIPLTKFFEYPTVSSLSEYIKTGFSISLQENSLSVQISTAVEKRRVAIRKKKNR